MCLFGVSGDLMPGWNRLARAISCFVSLCCYCCSAFARVGGGWGPRGAERKRLGVFEGRLVCVCARSLVPFRVRSHRCAALYHVVSATVVVVVTLL